MTTRQTSLLPERAGAHASDDAQMREFLGFVLGDERYALPLSAIREILRLPPVTEVPRGPEDVLGIISVRGQVTTLIDMRLRLRMPRKAIDSRTRVLLVERGGEVLGLLVDRVLQVFRMREDEMELASVLGADASAYVMGIGRPGSRRAVASGEHIREHVVDGQATELGDILILLDPMALLKPYGVD